MAGSDVTQYQSPQAASRMGLGARWHLGCSGDHGSYPQMKNLYRAQSRAKPVERNPRGQMVYFNPYSEWLGPSL
ncbi:hypothetical protein VZT92_001908 [Zoarces viviparus]|uniref:Uncharacterized protein n=1 Tax=Zoarces viviparus TaxID=48416 RepID=A0AAW1G5P0_ZOAVI